MAVLNELKSSGHKLMRCKVMLNLKRERENLIRMKRISIPTIQEISNEFAIIIQNKYSKLVNVNEMNGDRKL